MPLLPRVALAGEPTSEPASQAPSKPAAQDENAWRAGTVIRDARSRRTVALDETFGEDDLVTALQAIQYALTRVGDGETFVWYRPNSRLKGIVRPTSSFRDDKGQICRHIVFSLTLAERTRTIEGIACRARDKRWSLDG